MRISVTCYAGFRDVFGASVQIELADHATIRDAVRHLAQSAGADKDLLVDDSGSVREYVMIMYQNTRILPADADSVHLHEGDTLILFPPVSGG